MVNGALSKKMIPNIAWSHSGCCHEANETMRQKQKCAAPERLASGCSLAQIKR
jgi:hypothetical protein